MPDDIYDSSASFLEQKILLSLGFMQAASLGSYKYCLVKTV